MGAACGKLQSDGKDGEKNMEKAPAGSEQEPLKEANPTVPQLKTIASNPAITAMLKKIPSDTLKETLMGAVQTSGLATKLEEQGMSQEQVEEAVSHSARYISPGDGADVEAVEKEVTESPVMQDFVQKVQKVMDGEQPSDEKPEEKPPSPADNDEAEEAEVAKAADEADDDEDADDVEKEVENAAEEGQAAKEGLAAKMKRALSNSSEKMKGAGLSLKRRLSPKKKQKDSPKDEEVPPPQQVKNFLESLKGVLGSKADIGSDAQKSAAADASENAEGGDYGAFISKYFSGDIADKLKKMTEQIPDVDVDKAKEMIQEKAADVVPEDASSKLAEMGNGLQEQNGSMIAAK